MASQLKRDLMNLQKQNMLGTSSGFSTKSPAVKKSAGKAKFHTPDVTGSDRSPQNAPKPKKQTAQQRYFTPTPTGKATPNVKIKSGPKPYKSMPGM